MDIIFSTIDQILPVILLIWLPLDDYTLKSVLSYSISKLIVELLKKISNTLKKYATYFKFLNFFNKKYIIIDSKLLQYDNLLYYITDKYIKNILGFNAYYDDDSELKYKLEELNTISLEDIFDYQGNKYKIFLTTNRKENEKSNKISNEIIINGYCDINILKEYVNHVFNLVNDTTIKSEVNILKIYNLSFLETGKKKKKLQSSPFNGWKATHAITNKTLNNTILSKTVENEFVNSIDTFINSSDNYKKKGLPYKIGYILHGEPGCGKSSLVKSIALKYKIPIFALDIELVKDGETLLKIMRSINNYVPAGKIHIVLFEDFDRSELFHRYGNRTNISENTILNILDGVDENHGRITIFTANNVQTFTNIKALIRPGRIDKIIKITFCDKDQIIRTLQLFFDNNNIYDNIKDNIIITPANLIQIIMYVNKPELVIEILNDIIDFNKLKNEDLCDKLQTYLENDTLTCNDNINIIDNKKITKNIVNKNIINKNTNKNRIKKKVIKDNRTILVKIYENILIYIKMIELHLQNINVNNDININVNNDINNNANNNIIEDVKNVTDKIKANLETLYKHKQILFSQYGQINITINQNLEKYLNDNDITNDIICIDQFNILTLNIEKQGQYANALLKKHNIKKVIDKYGCNIINYLHYCFTGYNYRQIHDKYNKDLVNNLDKDQDFDENLNQDLNKDSVNNLDKDTKCDKKDNLNEIENNSKVNNSDYEQELEQDSEQDSETMISEWRKYDWSDVIYSDMDN